MSNKSSRQHNDSEIGKMFQSTNKQMGAARDLLSRMFRLILTDLGIDLLGYFTYVNKWLNNPRNGISTVSSDRSNERGNVIKEASRRTMQFHAFIKQLAVLNRAEAEIVVRLREEGKKDWTEHTIRLEHIPEYLRSVRRKRHRQTKRDTTHGSNSSTGYTASSGGNGDNDA